jgi:pimeloyl-ACP methyl ester carboxylesterase
VTSLFAAPPASALPAGSDPRTPSIPARYLTQQIVWTVCPFDAEVKQLYPQAPTTNCARVKAPMDWYHPDSHPDIEVAIAQSRATGTTKGSMMTNPGGPGAGGLTLSVALALGKPRLFSDFDLVGFDPRGFGQSTPLHCITTPEKLAALPTTPDYRERTLQTHRTEEAEAKLLAEACSATEFGRFVSSQQTVFDMELIRALLNSRRLHFIGYSYGTWLGGWYADTYPSRVGRFVLDSNMDFTRTQWQNMNFDPFSFQRRRDTQLFPWIARNAKLISGIGSQPSQVLAQYESIRADLVSLVKLGTSMQRGDGMDALVASAAYANVRFVRATLDILVHQEFVRDPSDDGDVDGRHVNRAWARIAPELQALDSLAAIRVRYGIPEESSGAVAPVDRLSGSSTRLVADARRRATDAKRSDAPIDLGAVGTTVRCNDTKWRKGSRYYLNQADQNTRRYPFIGYLNGVPMCAYWPYGAQDRDVDLRRSPVLLMVQAELDPATAWEGANRTHRTLSRTTRLVSIDDEGQHGQYVGGPSACAEAIGDAHVFSGEVPRSDRVCGTSPLPAETSIYPVNGPVDGNRVPLPNRRAAPSAKLPNPMLQKVLDQVASSQS